MPLRSQFKTEEEWIMHLRMYFAAKAMQGMCANIEFLKGASAAAGKRSLSLERHVADMAYELSDAMLKAREE